MVHRGLLLWDCHGMGGWGSRHGEGDQTPYQMDRAHYAHDLGCQRLVGGINGPMVRKGGAKRAEKLTGPAGMCIDGNA